MENGVRSTQPDIVRLIDRIERLRAFGTKVWVRYHNLRAVKPTKGFLDSLHKEGHLFKFKVKGHWKTSTHLIICANVDSEFRNFYPGQCMNFSVCEQLQAIEDNSKILGTESYVKGKKANWSYKKPHFHKK